MNAFFNNRHAINELKQRKPIANQMRKQRAISIATSLPLSPQPHAPAPPPNLIQQSNKHANSQARADRQLITSSQQHDKRHASNQTTTATNSSISKPSKQLVQYRNQPKLSNKPKQQQPPATLILHVSRSQQQRKLKHERKHKQ